MDDEFDPEKFGLEMLEASTDALTEEEKAVEVGTEAFDDFDENGNRKDGGDKKGKKKTIKLKGKAKKIIDSKRELEQLKKTKKIMLSAEDRQKIKKAKKLKNLQLNKLIADVFERFKFNLERFKQKVSTIAPPILTVLGIIAVVLLIVIVILAIFYMIIMIIASLFGGGGSGGSSIAGVTGLDFYGVRTIYKDDELASREMVEDYVDCVKDGVDEVKAIAEITITVNITFPDEEYDYTTFDEALFQSSYSVLYSAVFAIAKTVYNEDNMGQYGGTSLMECLNGVKYFGIVGAGNKLEALNEIIIANSTYTESGSTELLAGSSYENTAKDKLNTLFGEEKYNTRAEKLFVKDYFFAGEDSSMADIPAKHYISYIYMPRHDVVFNSFVYGVGCENLDGFNIKVKGDGATHTFRKDKSNLGDDENPTYLYMCGGPLNKLRMKAGKFEEIDYDNLGALADHMSLFDVIRTVDNISIYMEQQAGGIWTMKQNGVVIEFEHDQPFAAIEVETIWKVK